MENGFLELLIKDSHSNKSNNWLRLHGRKTRRGTHNKGHKNFIRIHKLYLLRNKIMKEIEDKYFDLRKEDLDYLLNNCKETQSITLNIK